MIAYKLWQTLSIELKMDISARIIKQNIFIQMCDHFSEYVRQWCQFWTLSIYEHGNATSQPLYHSSICKSAWWPCDCPCLCEQLGLNFKCDFVALTFKLFLEKETSAWLRQASVILILISKRYLIRITSIISKYIKVMEIEDFILLNNIPWQKRNPFNRPGRRFKKTKKISCSKYAWSWVFELHEPDTFTKLW